MNPESTPRQPLSEQIARWEGLLTQRETLELRRAQAQATRDECDLLLAEVEFARLMLIRVEDVLYPLQTVVLADANPPAIAVDGNVLPQEAAGDEITALPEQAAVSKNPGLPAGPDDDTSSPAEEPPLVVSDEDVSSGDALPPAAAPEPDPQPEPAAPVAVPAPADPSLASESSVPRAQRPARFVPEPQEPPPFKAPVSPDVTEEDCAAVLKVLRSKKSLMSRTLLLNRLLPWKMGRLMAVLDQLERDDRVISADGGQRWRVA